MKSDGTVKQTQKINGREGGLSGGLGTHDQFGFSVDALGDLDGDGAVDLVVGAVGGERSLTRIPVPGTEDQFLAAREVSLTVSYVLVLFLDQSGVVKAEQKIRSNEGGLGPVPVSAQFGRSVACVGDIDGDGVVDLAVGAPGDQGTGSTQEKGVGSVYVLLLHATGTVKAQHRIGSEHGGILHPLNENDQFGASLATLGGGGLGGDAGVRLVVGASWDDDGGVNRGAVYLLQVPPGYLPLCDEASSSRDTTTCLNTGGEGAYECVEEDYFHGSCERNTGGCSQRCYDTISGYFWCGCDTGYFLDDDGVSCTDVDECETNNGGCSHVCINSNGGFSCACDPGYKLSSDDRTVCNDINECAVDNGGCGVELCLNHDGGFWCGCHTLYALDSNGNCIDVDECTENNGGCEQLCLNHAGGFSCDCPIGYLLGVNGTCTEVDQCEIDNGGCGRLHCFNRSGSYSCGCNAGYVLNADGTNCIDLFCGSLGTLLPGEAKISSQYGGLAPLPDHSRMGTAVAWIGDVDGDMVPDLAVGASKTPSSSEGFLYQGAVHILMMTETGTVKTEQTIGRAMGGLQARISAPDAFGLAVAGLGDVDGDGVPDIAVGADQNHGIWGVSMYQGAVYVLRLRRSGEVKGEQEINSFEGGLVTPLDNYGNFGSAIAGLGDVDGDGVPDMAVGASGTGQSSGAKNEVVAAVGVVYILGLNATGGVKWERTVFGVRGRMAVYPDDYGMKFGTSVAALGDLNRDGVGDIAVGTPGTFCLLDGGQAIPHGEAVYVIFLSPDGTVKGEQKLSSTEGGLISSLGDRECFGRSVSSLGDLDGDGVPDLAVGAPRDSDSGIEQGALYVLLLHADGTVKKEAKIRGGDFRLGLSGTVAVDDHDQIGMGLAAAVGGLNGGGGGEGIVTLAVGSPGDDDDGDERGAVYVIRVPLGLMELCDTDAGETCVNTHDGGFSCNRTAVLAAG